jgi:hypothetical protein
MIDGIIGFKKPEFQWGEMNRNKLLKDTVNDEIFVKDVYQKFFKVEENDTVVDVGASAGPFTYSILHKNWVVEPKMEKPNIDDWRNFKNDL